MKKSIIIVVLTTLAAVSSSSAFAAAGTVNFAGNILDSACDVAIASQNQTVIIGDFYKSEFQGMGAKTAAKDFDIVLKNCPDTVTSAKVRFDGASDLVNPSLLAINDSVAGAATGVAINLMSADKADLPLNGENNYNYVLSSSQDNNLKFYAQYISTAASVTAGPANSVANFSVVYN